MAIKTIKLEKAMHRAPRAMPERMSLTELAGPPMLATATTSMEIRKAPIKAHTPTPLPPSTAPSPKNRAVVAPSDAPEEMPST